MGNTLDDFRKWKHHGRCACGVLDSFCYMFWGYLGVGFTLVIFHIGLREIEMMRIIITMPEEFLLSSANVHVGAVFILLAI